MKTIFYFFLALNVAFFIWQFSARTGNGSVVASTALPPGVNKLKLVTEVTGNKKQDKANAKLKEQMSKLEAATRVSKAAPEPQPKPRQKPKRDNQKLEICYSLGPFEGQTQVKSISAKLKDLGAVTYDRKEKLRVPIGFWVYLPRFKSWNAARRQVMELEKKGMTDIFIMGRGRMKNAVSLGLFKEENSAKNRLKKMKEFGIEPKMETQYTVDERYWIDIDVEAGKKQVISAIEAIAKGLTILDLKTRKCS